MNASAAGKEGTGNLVNLTGIRYKQYGFEGARTSDFLKATTSMVMARSLLYLRQVTPRGSVITFVSLHNGTRYAFVGNLAWQLEGITLRDHPQFGFRMLRARAKTCCP